jgi:hypothetical protein
LFFIKGRGIYTKKHWFVHTNTHTCVRWNAVW